MPRVQNEGKPMESQEKWWLNTAAASYMDMSEDCHLTELFHLDILN